MNVRYRVDLSQIERTELRALLSGGKHASRKLDRRIDDPKRLRREIAAWQRKRRATAIFLDEPDLGFVPLKPRPEVLLT